MNTIQLFDLRFANYMPGVDKTEAIYRQCNDHTECVSSPLEVFEAFKKTSYKPGDVCIGTINSRFGSSSTQFILIFSKVGLLMLCKERDEIVYLAEAQFAICASAKRHGYGEQIGVVEDVEQLNHAFAIPDSYV